MFPLLTTAEAAVEIFFLLVKHRCSSLIYDQTTVSVLITNGKLFSSVIRVTRHLLEQTFVSTCIYYCYQFCSLLFLKSHHLPFRKRFGPCFYKNSKRVSFTYTLSPDFKTGSHLVFPACYFLNVESVRHNFKEFYLLLFLKCKLSMIKAGIVPL